MKQGISSFLIVALLVSGCATAPPHKPLKGARPSNVKEWLATQSRARRSAWIAATIGALAGAAVGVVSGGNREDILTDAIIGGFAGAVAGFALGKHQDRLFAGRDLAVRQANYERSQGYVARIEQVAFHPSNPKPGDTATLYVRYLVLGPNPSEKIRVRLFRGLKYGDAYVFGAGPNEFDVPQGGGIVESSVQLTLPKKVPQGTYSIEALVDDEKGRFEQVIGTNALYIVAGAQPRHATAIAAR
jgi:hypothetical protein